MDKRIEKTRKAIYSSFTDLINTTDYDKITIQDIIDASNIGRSTFYMHFKTKDELLSKISQDIFNHVFSSSLTEEKSHNFSKANVLDYNHLITHIFYHIRDEKELIKGIMLSKCNYIFLDDFKNHLHSFVNSYYLNYQYEDSTLPLKLKKDILVDNFITIIKYWINDDFRESPEQLTNYFISLV